MWQLKNGSSLSFLASMLRLLCAAALAVAATAGEAKLVRTAWGVDAIEDPAKWLGWMTATAAEGYAAIEAPTWVVCIGAPIYGADGSAHECDGARVAKFKEALAASGLAYVAQIHTGGVPIASASVDAHVASLRNQATLAVDALGALFLNAHDGVDIWTDAETIAYFRAAVALESDLGVAITHETHRTRALATPRTTLLVLEAFPTLKLTADLSHWVVSAERAFDYPSDGAWWPAVLGHVADRAYLTHTRVGSAEAIQVNDPSAPEHAALVERYESWWAIIWARQRANGRDLWIEPEYGPPPYLPVAPRTEEPLADLAAVVAYMTARHRAQLRRAASPDL